MAAGQDKMGLCKTIPFMKFGIVRNIIKTLPADDAVQKD